VKALGVGTVLIALMAVLAMLDDETGLGIWEELRRDLGVSHARVEALRRENEALQREIDTLEVDPAALHRAIREELDLALPGEIVVHFGTSGVVGPPRGISSARGAGETR